jgi:hypothetical protein
MSLTGGREGVEISIWSHQPPYVRTRGSRANREPRGWGPLQALPRSANRQTACHAAPRPSTPTSAADLTQMKTKKENLKKEWK